MARSRNIKPALFKNEILGEADPILTVLFTGLWCLADREGRLEDRPKRIKAEILPYREIDAPMFNGYLTELQQLGFIDRYEVADQPIIQVLNFLKHQSPHKTEKDSDLPEKPEITGGCKVTDKAPLNNGSLTDEESLIPDSLNTDSLKEQGETAAPRKRGCRLPADWQPSKDLKKWAEAERPDLDIQKTIDSFTDYWTAKTGAMATKLDWDATFRNWVRNEKSTRHSNGTRETPVQRSDRIIKEKLARLGHPS